MFRRWIDYQIEHRCYKCKQIINPVMAGLINVGTMVHNRDECPMREFGHIESCPHCGKDLTGL